MAEVTLQIDGMSCHHCLNTVQKALATVIGASIHTVQMGRAVVVTSDDGPTPEQVAAVVSAVGYPAMVVSGT